MLELAKLSGSPISEPFRNQGEQINEAAFKFESENPLLEAKWQDKAANEGRTIRIVLIDGSVILHPTIT